MPTEDPESDKALLPSPYHTLSDESTWRDSSSSDSSSTLKTSPYDFPLSRKNTNKKPFLAGLLTGLLIPFSLLAIYHFTTWYNHTRVLSCGDSIASAKRLNCIFDPLTIAWLPPQCSRAGTSEFLLSNSASSPISRINNVASSPSTCHYYTNSSASTEVMDMGAKLGTEIYYTTHGEHLSHCAYILIRAAEAREKGERIDHTSGATRHTRHCALFLLENARESRRWGEVMTAGNVVLGGC